MKKENENYILFEEISKNIKHKESKNKSLLKSTSNISINIKANIIKMIINGNSRKKININLKKKYFQQITFKPKIKKTIFFWIDSFIFLIASTLLIIYKKKKL